MAAFALACLVLGYGYWHSETHGAVYFNLEYENRQSVKPGWLAKARVKFKGRNGRVLAEGVRDDELGIVHLIDPETGGCHEIEASAAFSAQARSAWYECFAKQSTWIPGWIDEVRQVQVVHDNCTTTDIPVEIITSNSDWLLWWIPHPHIGGKPYSYYSATIVVKQADCIAKAG